MDTGSFRIALPKFNNEGKHSKGHVKWIYLYMQKWKLNLFASDEEGIPAFPGV